MYSTRENEDLVVTFNFRHKKTEAIPEGREILCLADGTVLTDAEFNWEDLQIYCISPSKIHNTAFSYTPGFDLLAINNALDILYSTFITNQVTFGVQNIWSEKGSELTVRQLAGGMNHIQTRAGMSPPQPLQLTATAPELFKGIELLEKALESLSGVNAVSRGDTPSSLKSGSALALVASRAIEYNDAFKSSYQDVAARVGDATIKRLQRHATTKRVADIVGKNKRSYQRTFDKSSLDGISRVLVEQINPLFNTTSGKLDVANSMLQAGMIKTPDHYLEVIETGRTEPLTENSHAEYMNIKAENETMREGGEARAMLTDKHTLHIMEHSALLASPEARNNPALVMAVTRHLEEHEMLWMQLTSRPALLAALQQQPAPMPMMPQQQGGPPPPQGEGVNTEVPPDPNSPEVQMPTNPLDGQKVPTPQ
jgi:hypothetical protein